jgi:hypothetical protein
VLCFGPGQDLSHPGFKFRLLALDFEIAAKFSRAS